ncbi:hypothetical protein YPPY88_0035, partial [Yersinia pestis PY-88]
MGVISVRYNVMDDYNREALAIVIDLNLPTQRR